jgi:intracellular septation protein
VLPELVLAASACGLLLVPRFTGKNPLRAIMGGQVQLPDAVWNRLTLAWAVFFACMGALNLFIAYSFPLDVWVNFKVFGTLALTVVFVVIQALWISRFAEDAQP